MPLTKAAKAEYPAGWFDPAERAKLLERAGNRCECRGECGQAHGPRDIFGEPMYLASRCERRQGDFGKSYEVLTRAHLCQDPGCPECCQNLEHIKVYCRGCHLRYDSRQAQRALRKRKKLERRGQGQLFGEATQVLTSRRSE